MQESADAKIQQATLHDIPHYPTLTMSDTQLNKKCNKLLVITVVY